MPAPTRIPKLPFRPADKFVLPSGGVSFRVDAKAVSGVVVEQQRAGDVFFRQRLVVAQAVAVVHGFVVLAVEEEDGRHVGVRVQLERQVSLHFARPVAPPQQVAARPLVHQPLLLHGDYGVYHRNKRRPERRRRRQAQRRHEVGVEVGGRYSRQVPACRKPHYAYLIGVEAVPAAHFLYQRYSPLQVLYHGRVPVAVHPNAVAQHKGGNAFALQELGHLVPFAPQGKVVVAAARAYYHRNPRAFFLSGNVGR